MNHYTFSINVFAVHNGRCDMTKPIATITEQVEAERRSSACVKAWEIITPIVKRIASVLTVEVALGDLDVQAI